MVIQKMNKSDYIVQVRTRIGLGSFNDQVFYARNDIEIIENEISISEFANFYCPWAHINGEHVEFDMALLNPLAKYIRVKDDELINYRKDRKEKIDNYQHKKIDLWPIPLAHDLATGKYLILDSNHTSISLFRKYKQDRLDKNLHVLILRGENLEDLIGDFIIVNRN